MNVSKLFINLPVHHVARAQAFYAALGAQVQPDYTNEQAACMKVSEHLYVMLLDRAFFGTFTALPIADARATTQVLLAIDQDSREAVDALLHTACQAGATESRAVQDLGFMYSRAFADPDRHIWEIFWMNPQTPPPQEN